MPIRCVIFDFDGTLVDSNEVKLSAFYEVTAHISGASHELDRIFQDPDRGDRFDIIATLQARLGLDGDGLIKAYGQRCETVILDKLANSRVTDTLDTLKAEGRKLFIASATPEVNLVAMLDKSALAARFDGIHGRPAGKAEILNRIMDNYDLQPSTMVLVGDGEDDYRGAAEFGCRFIGIGPEFAGRAEAVIGSVETLVRPGFFEALTRQADDLAFQ
jgi:phosphoglycolate phosphatase-like HAD superfamily hydrolase